jgi:hypothetical protein
MQGFKTLDQDLGHERHLCSGSRGAMNVRERGPQIVAIRAVEILLSARRNALSNIQNLDIPFVVILINFNIHRSISHHYYSRP